MAKNDKKSKSGSKGNPLVKPAASIGRGSSRGEEKRAPGPRGTVSTKPKGRVRNFLREVRIEMKKVTWPPRKELIKSTGVVIVAVVIAAVFIGIFDLLWSFIIDKAGMGG